MITTNNYNFNVVIPIFNESENISLLLSNLHKIAEKIGTFNLIIVNDGSTDDTLKKIHDSFTKKFKFKLYIINLSRNWGKDPAMISSLDLLISFNNKFTIFMDGDLQHPINQLPKMIKEYFNGFKIIMNKKINYKVSFIRKILNFFFYFIMNKFTQNKIIPSLSDFCLIDNSVLPNLKKSYNHNSVFRSAIFWLGYKRKILEVKINPRDQGKTSFNNSKLVSLAINTIISYSNFPIKLLLIFSVLMIVILLFIIYSSIFLNTFSSYTLLLLIYLSTILVLFFVSLIGLYIGKIIQLSSDKPLYIIENIERI